MANEAAASPPGHGPRDTKPSDGYQTLATSEPTVSGDREAESEIRYPITSRSVSWPRVFPQL
jgi:hypothetical protein